MTKTKNIWRQAARRKAGVLASLALAGAVTLTVAGCNSGGGSAGGPAGTGGGGGAVVTVNGQSVERNALHAHLEANYGESAVRQLIDYALITQKLQAEELEVTDAEVNASIESRRANNPEIAQILEAKGPRLEALQRQTRYQLALDKLLTKDVTVKEDELKKWFETRRKYYDQPARAKIGILLSSTKTRADTMAAQLKSKSKSFQELVNEQQAANDPAARSSIAETPEMINVAALPTVLSNTINGLSAGASSGVVTLQEGEQTAYAVLRVVEKQPAVKADFTKLRQEAELDYKLEQVARKLNSENPSNPPFDQTLERVQGAVAAQSGGQNPSFREILTFINQTAASNLTNGLRTAAKVEANDPAYAQVAESFKPVPGAGTPEGAPAGNGATESTPAPAAPAGNAASDGAPAGNAAK